MKPKMTSLAQAYLNLSRARAAKDQKWIAEAMQEVLEAEESLRDKRPVLITNPDEEI